MRILAVALLTAAFWATNVHTVMGSDDQPMSSASRTAGQAQRISSRPRPLIPTGISEGGELSGPRVRMFYRFALSSGACPPVITGFRVAGTRFMTGLACHDQTYHVAWSHRLAHRHPLELLTSSDGTIPHFLATWKAPSGAVTVIAGRWQGRYAPAIMRNNRLQYSLTASSGLEVFGVDRFIVAPGTGRQTTYVWNGTAYKPQPSSGADASNQPVSLQIDTKQQPVKLHLVGVATDDQEQGLGLMDVHFLAPSSGMLFSFASDTNAAFWMENTPIPLSIAFVSSAGTILDIQEMAALDDTTFHIACGSAHPCAYRYAVEANSGFFSRHHVSIDDKVECLLASTAGTG